MYFIVSNRGFVTGPLKNISKQKAEFDFPCPPDATMEGIIVHDYGKSFGMRE